MATGKESATLATGPKQTQKGLRRRKRTKGPADGNDITRPIDVCLGVLVVEAAGGEDKRWALGRRLVKDERLVIADLGWVDSTDDRAELQKGEP